MIAILASSFLPIGRQINLGLTFLYYFDILVSIL